MAIPATNNLDMAGFQILNLKLQVLVADPAGLTVADEGRVWYNSSNDQIRYWDGATVQILALGGSGGPPTGAAGGVLAGTYPNPGFAAGAVDNAALGTAAVTTDKIADGTIVDGDIAAGAAIALSKIAGAVRKYGQTVGNGAATTFNLPHNLNTTDIGSIVCIRLSDGALTILPDPKVVDANTVSVTFGAPPANNAYRLVVLA